MTGWPYMTKTAAVIPFSPGTVVYRDGMLSHLYYETKKAGRLELVMCGDNPSHDEFIGMFEPRKKVLQILCEVKDQGTAQESAIPVGYSWVELPKGVDGNRAAMCGFAFFRKTWELVALGMLGIHYWVDGMKINVLHGVMLHSNESAYRYAYRLGFRESAHVPSYHFHEGSLVSARVMTLQESTYGTIVHPWICENAVASQSKIS